LREGREKYSTEGGESFEYKVCIKAAVVQSYLSICECVGGLVGDESKFGVSVVYQGRGREGKGREGKKHYAWSGIGMDGSELAGS
jgi:hypothetical protein